MMNIFVCPVCAARVDAVHISLYNPFDSHKMCEHETII